MALVALTLAASGCGVAQGLGFRNRVLHRIPSPADASVVAVCQEIPEFDGPGYDIRLERPDGVRIQTLYQIGDGDPCSEIAWRSDGRMLAVLSTHVARVHLVDLDFARAHPGVATAYDPNGTINFSTDRTWRWGKRVRFVSTDTIAVDVCTADRRHPVAWEYPCLDAPVTITNPVNYRARAER